MEMEVQYLSKKKYAAGWILLCAAAMAPNTQAWAITSENLVTAVQDAGVTESPVSIKIDHSSVAVSTFLNKERTDDESKIGAALIARAVIEAAPNELNGVTVYFYNTTLTKCKSVSVTAADVKAFGSGALNKDQLLSALNVRDERLSDLSSNVDTFLQSKDSSNDQSVSTKITGPVMELSTKAEAWMNDQQLKLEAFRLADKAQQVASPSVQKIVVNFADTTNPKKIRQVTIEIANLQSIHNTIVTLLQPLPITNLSSSSNYNDLDWQSAQRSTTEKFAVQSLEAVPGVDLEDRKVLLDRIKTLDKMGIGVEPFVDSFLAIEERAKNGEEKKLADAIEDLGKQIDEQEKKYKAAQEFHPARTGTFPKQ
ncbi:MAG TPA: hypothetical protein V6C81_07700 [Planktothrix sp.]